MACVGTVCSNALDATLATCTEGTARRTLAVQFRKFENVQRNTPNSCEILVIVYSGIEWGDRNILLEKYMISI